MLTVKIAAATMSVWLLAGAAIAQDGGGENARATQRGIVGVDAEPPTTGKVGRSVGATPSSETPVSTDDIKPNSGNEAGCIRSNSLNNGGLGAGNTLPGGHSGVATSGTGSGGGGGGPLINPPAASCPPQAPIPMPF
jgi:hypothetical protein